MKQEERKTIEPQAHLLQSKRRHLDEDERYSYLINVRNPADSGHFIARAELSVDYRSRDGVVVTVKVPAERVAKEEVAYLGDESSLDVPVNLAAREAIEGWIHFKFAKSLVSDHDVDRFVVLLETGDGGTLSLESIIPMDA
ncbi:hypothetical protein ACIBCS_42220 [Streptomyces phaeochromogenes]|uniref:hypothetical protein n=1 Tax=Streptomyces phaeochromogenes TaxID=1923 RepID=UPI0033ED5C78